MSDATRIKGWFTAAHHLWEQGKKIPAIQCLIQEINKNPKNTPTIFQVQLGYYLFLINDFRSASKVLLEAHKQEPKNWEILFNLSASLSRSREYQKSIDYLSKAPKNVLDDNFLAQDILCGCYAKLEKWEQAKQAGESSLSIKHRKASNHKPPVKEEKKRPILDNLQRQDVIAFSLWGDQPRYLRGAIDNVIESQKLYPDWQCRFYLDKSVPHLFVDELRKLGAEIIMEVENQSIKEKLTWRFKPTYDKTVRRYLIRDVDSVVNLREKEAVNEWLSSDKSFHVMRDWWTHTDLILAGMWGGISEAIPHFDKRLERYKPNALSTPNIDQWFLRDCIWPYICNDSLIHDRCFNSFKSQPWPSAPQDDYHVGQDIFTAHKNEQTIRIEKWINKLDCLKISE